MDGGGRGIWERERWSEIESVLLVLCDGLLRD